MTSNYGAQQTTADQLRLVVAVAETGLEIQKQILATQERVARAAEIQALTLIIENKGTMTSFEQPARTKLSELFRKLTD